ncbi:MAG: hypothetical protein IJ662_08450 [Clostridia bacterium]|nr:hypothetical protein [Clostridia bacterium]
MGEHAARVAAADFEQAGSEEKSSAAASSHAIHRFMIDSSFLKSDISL